MRKFKQGDHVIVVSYAGVSKVNKRNTEYKITKLGTRGIFVNYDGNHEDDQDAWIKVNGQDLDVQAEDLDFDVTHDSPLMKALR